MALLGISLGAVCSAGHAGVQGSKHDLSSLGRAQQTTTATNEVCVFCHTPHGSDIAAPVPLWNKRLPTGTGYQRYSSLGTVSLDGTEAPVGSVSLACLSCHDGTQAMDVVINAPGSGGWTPGGAELSLQDIGPMTGTPVPNLTTDLRDDHPISIQYAGGGCSATDPACGALRDPDFVRPSTDVINGTRVWWVDTGTLGTRQKSDMILYTRNDAIGGAGTVEPFVECGSCHDPHEDVPRPVSFLRVDNTGSAVCLSCHIK